MRVFLPLFALPLAAGAAAEPVDLTPGPARIATTGDSSQSAPEGRVICRDTVEQVRAQRGLPLLRENAAPDEPLMIAAVDHRINGCAVMVMYGNTSDVRPLPAPRDGAPLLERIPGG
jgi:hypothetical protein